MAPENISVSAKLIETLALVYRNNADYQYLLKRGLLSEAVDLNLIGLLNRIVVEEDNSIYYSITDRGKEYFEKILEFAHDNIELPVYTKSLAKE